MKKFMIFPLLASAILYTSCGSVDYNETIRTPEEMFYNGQYLEAAKLLLPVVNKKGKEQLLFMMECGYMLHAGGETDKSNSVLLPAGKLARVIPVSITQQAQSLLTNNTATNYMGEDFEKVLVHMYLGINFLMNNKNESAGVEFKLVNEELDKIRNEGTNSARYKQNIMAKYLTAAAYEALGNENNDMDDIEYAYTELKQINSLNSNIDLVREDLQKLSKKLGYDDDYAQWVTAFGKRDIPDDSGELMVIFQSGRSAIKKSRGKILDDISMKNAIDISFSSMTAKQGVTIAAILATLATAENPIPYFEARTDATHHLRIKAAQKTFKTTMLEDISSTAVKNLQDDYTMLKAKVAASIVLKAAASIGAGLVAQELAKKAGAGSFSGLIGTVAGAGTGAALFSSMKPDLRCWHTLPAKLHIGRTFLPPGSHTITIEYVGAGGVKDVRQLDVEIKKGKKTFLNIRTLI
ncbi:MAG: hypothetical protein FWG13_03285 [Leptospirales bacterium]|nr:hypothetical protein [Leptospirales bacterium]